MITYFNPPFSENVKTNIGKEFLKLVSKHFPPDHKLHPLFILDQTRALHMIYKGNGLNSRSQRLRMGISPLASKWRMRTLGAV